MSSACSRRSVDLAPDLSQLRDGGKGVLAGREGAGEVEASGVLACDLTEPERDH